MQRRAVLGDLGRRAARLAALVVLSVTPALAGDRALLEVIGYSPDGRHFAFEEFGIQDGSGFPFSHIYVIDLADDVFVPGTPVSLRIDSEDATLAEARAQNAGDAESVLARFAIGAPAEILVLNGDGAIEPDFRRLRFGVPGYGQAEPRSDITLVLDTHETTAPHPCEDWFARSPQGFALTLEQEGETRLVHRDERLPRSRGCALDYRLYSVVQPGWAQDIDAAVALIAVYAGGFEGPDRRFIAVPLGQ